MTDSGDVQGFTKPLDTTVYKRPSFKQYLKKKTKKKDEDVLQKQENS